MPRKTALSAAALVDEKFTEMGIGPETLADGRSEIYLDCIPAALTTLRA